MSDALTELGGGGGGYRLITFKKSPKNRLKVMEKRVEYVHVEL